MTDFIYEDPVGRHWIAPAGWKVDGASIPQVLWSAVGGPFEGKYREASVIHDYECDKKVSPWREVHYRFYMGMLARGVSLARAKGMYWAVFNYGPKWDQAGNVTRPPEPARLDLDRVLSYIERRERGDILQPAAPADPAVRRRVEDAREQVRRAKASLSAAESMSVQIAGGPEPKNELERIAREELQRRVEQRKAAASAAIAQANSTLTQAEAEEQRSIGPPRPMPPMEREELEALAVAQIPR